MPQPAHPSQDSRDSEPRDSGALVPDQLSDGELRIILEIERRLDQAKGSTADEEPSGPERYLKTVRDQHARVLLLDGGRGTGKTSLLLTLVQRWHYNIFNTARDARGMEEAYVDRTARLSDEDQRFFREAYRVEVSQLGLPRNIRVLSVLDFDPLPPGMPLIAGIMQAWRLLAEAFDRRGLQRGDYDQEQQGGLLDHWHRLFHTAASGWGSVSDKKGLLEQVLDRQDQVENWQRVGEDWRSFVEVVLKKGRTLEENETLGDDTVFVIMIDDCDLQVGRIRQLLPALRMLYHPRVFFLVAGDQRHLIDMLLLDFYGQQQELARHQNARQELPLDLAQDDPWSHRLAQASFDKVFPKANRWELKRLTLLDFLAFPKSRDVLPPHQPTANNGVLANEPPTVNSGPTAEIPDSAPQNPPNEPWSRTLFDYLNKFDSREGAPNAGDLILKFARESNDVLPGIMSYRSAEQLFRHAARFDEPRRAAEILLRLLSQDRNEGRAVLRNDGIGSNVSVEVRTSGELTALYPRGPQVPAGTYNVFLGTRPDFAFIGPSGAGQLLMSTAPEHRFNFPGGLIAKMLEEAGLSVDAGGLAWNTNASHAWTEWNLTPSMSFQWTPHEHPRPDQLFSQTRDWASFILKMKEVNEPEDDSRLARYAYAWVYYQRRWKEGSSPVGLKAPEDLSGPPGGWPWQELLDFSAVDRKQKERWMYETLPLLARPEMGFPPLVQKRFLSVKDKDVVALDKAPNRIIMQLRRERLRRVTDAVHAARVRNGQLEFDIPPDSQVENIAAQIDDIYAEVFKGVNHWKTIVAKRAVRTTSKVTTPRSRSASARTTPGPKSPSAKP